MFRAALLACAVVAMAAAAQPVAADTPQNEQTSAQCEEMNLRVYFAHGSAALDPMGREMLQVAERHVAACPYAEMHVRVDVSEPYAQARGQAIMAAAHERTWNVAHIEPQGGMRAASLSSGPDFAEVLMTPRVMPPAPQLTDRNVGA